ncbi:MAG: hypothetical protein AAB267_00200, partial [Candidatus Desantisbacteria bacterium]
ILRKSGLNVGIRFPIALACKTIVLALSELNQIAQALAYCDMGLKQLEYLQSSQLSESEKNIWLELALFFRFSQGGFWREAWESKGDVKALWKSQEQLRLALKVQEELVNKEALEQTAANIKTSLASTLIYLSYFAPQQAAALLEEAQSLTEEALKITQGNHIAALFMQADIAVARKDWHRAVILYNSIYEKISSTADEPSVRMQGFVVCGLVKSYLAREELDKLEYWLAKLKASPEALIAAQYYSAVRDLIRASRIEPEEPTEAKRLYQLASDALEQILKEDRIYSLRRIYEIMNFYLYLIVARVRVGKTREAMEIAKEYIRQKLDIKELAKVLVNTFRKLEDYLIFSRELAG